MVAKSDAHWMQEALRLAQKQLGRVAPNPAVGCVIVLDDTIIASGVTQDGGRPHAEVVALESCSGNLKKATLYVTLEPCCHYGQTPPCTEAIIRSGIRRVVIATQDPYEEVSGKGIKQLRKAGIEVVEGVLEEEAKELNIGFMKVHQQGLPWVTLKVATSLDGRIATQTGDSRWITNEKSRHYVHQLRARHDGILTGIGTVLSDDPMLNCRLEEDVKQPVRIVLDSNLRISQTSQLIKTAKEIPVWLVASEEGKVGDAETITVPSLAGVMAIKPILEELAKRGITRLLVEAGSAVCTSFLRAGVVDQLVWCRAPIILGDKGMPVFQELAIDTIDEALKLSPIERSFKGSDLIETYQFT